MSEAAQIKWHMLCLDQKKKKKERKKKSKAGTEQGYLLFLHYIFILLAKRSIQAPIFTQNSRVVAVQHMPLGG